jgi:hypothetical protein
MRPAVCWGQANSLRALGGRACHLERPMGARAAWLGLGEGLGFGLFANPQPDPRANGCMCRLVRASMRVSLGLG